MHWYNYYIHHSVTKINILLPIPYHIYFRYAILKTKFSQKLKHFRRFLWYHLLSQMQVTKGTLFKTNKTARDVSCCCYHIVPGARLFSKAFCLSFSYSPASSNFGGRVGRGGTEEYNNRFQIPGTLVTRFERLSDRSIVPRFYMNNLEIARCTNMLCCFNVKPKVARLQILFS